MAVNAQTIVVWLRRLIALDTKVFDDVKNSPNATIPAVIVAAAATFIAGIGGWLWWIVRDYGHAGDVLFKSAVLGSLFSIALWALWLGLVYVMLSQVFRERVYLEQLLRVMGLAATPLALMGLMFIPGLDFGIALASIGLLFGLTGIAIQSVTTADPARVLVSNLVGFTVWSCALTLLVSSSNAYAPGIFLFNAPADSVSDQGGQLGSFYNR